MLQGVGLTPDLFPATFSLARHAGWTAHVLEQAADNRLIRPDVHYIGPAERDLPGLTGQRPPGLDSASRSRRRHRASAVASGDPFRDPLDDVPRVPAGARDEHRREGVLERDAEEVEARARSG